MQPQLRVVPPMTTTTPNYSAQNKHREERGEGVISTAIAVLIVAILGGVAYLGFETILNSGTDRARTKVEQIGQG